MTLGHRLLVGLLSISVLFSAFAVVFSKHMSRTWFVELQTLQQYRDDLQTEWGQLLLEQNTWASQSRVERIARQELDMVLPQADQIMFVSLHEE